MWRLAVEGLGVLVFQTGIFGGHYPVDVKSDMRGVAIHFDRLPIILVNSQDSLTGRIFTFMHELGHLILRQSGLSNFADFEDLVPDEVFCSAFASELLIPSSAILSDPVVRDHHCLEWSEDDLCRLESLYKVSKAVILGRLFENGMATESNYKDLRDKGQEEADFMNGSMRGLKRGGPAYHMKFVRCHGTRFVATLFDAYDRNMIHAGQLSEYLGVKLKHLESIRSDLAKALS